MLFYDMSHRCIAYDNNARDESMFCASFICQVFGLHENNFGTGKPSVPFFSQWIFSGRFSAWNTEFKSFPGKFIFLNFNIIAAVIFEVIIDNSLPTWLKQNKSLYKNAGNWRIRQSWCMIHLHFTSSRTHDFRWSSKIFP